MKRKLGPEVLLSRGIKYLAGTTAGAEQDTTRRDRRRHIWVNWDFSFNLVKQHHYGADIPKSTLHSFRLIPGKCRWNASLITRATVQEKQRYTIITLHPLPPACAHKALRNTVTQRTAQPCIPPPTKLLIASFVALMAATSSILPFRLLPTVTEST